MEVSQAIWLPVFFVGALLISPKRFDEIILDFYQDAGIWIVIASCVAEYLLLLTYIGVAAYDFFKNRKMMKKMNVQRRTYEFLKFDESHRDVGNRLIKIMNLEVKQAPKKTVSKYPKNPGWRPHQVVLSQTAVRLEPAPLNQNAPSNPQLLKFDGQSKIVNTKKMVWRQKPSSRLIRMNKSLKRKQIE